MAEQVIHSLLSSLDGYYTHIDTLYSGDLNVSAGNVRVPLNFNGHNYRMLWIELNLQQGNPGTGRGLLMCPLANNNVRSAIYIPVQLGPTAAWVRLECSNQGLTIISFGGSAALFVENVYGMYAYE